MAPGGTGDGSDSQPRSQALRQVHDLVRLIALAHRLGLATPGHTDRSQLEDLPSPAEVNALHSEGTEPERRWRVTLRLSGPPLALDAFAPALAQELPHAHIERITRLNESVSPQSTTAADLTLSLRYPDEAP